MSEITIYTRQGCHLCDVMHDQVRESLGERDVPIRLVDVDTSLELKKLYGLKVPVLAVDGEELCHYRLDRELLERVLAR